MEQLLLKKQGPIITPCCSFWTINGYSSVGCPLYTVRWSLELAAYLPAVFIPCLHVPICFSSVFQGVHSGSADNHTDHGRCVWLGSCIRMENDLRVTCSEDDQEVGERSQKWEGGQDGPSLLLCCLHFLSRLLQIWLSLELSIWSHCHFAQNNVVSEMKASEIKLELEGLWWILQALASVDRRKTTVSSQDIYSLWISSKATQLEVPAFSFSEGWVVVFFLFLFLTTAWLNACVFYLLRSWWAYLI